MAEINLKSRPLPRNLRGKFTVRAVQQPLKLLVGQLGHVLADSALAEAKGVVVRIAVVPVFGVFLKRKMTRSFTHSGRIMAQSTKYGTTPLANSGSTGYLINRTTCSNTSEMWS